MSHRDDLLVLAHHGVDDERQFEAQVVRLLEVRQPLSADDLHRALRDGQWPQEPSFFLTFDDGHRSVLECGLPILKRYDVPAVTYVITGLVDSTMPFWWDEVDRLITAGARAAGLSQDPPTAVRELKTMPNSERVQRIDELRDGCQVATSAQLSSGDLMRLRDGGISIGNHTRTHPCLDRCTDREVIDEIRTSHEALTDMLGSPPTSFAYPNGNWDPRAEGILSELGYLSAVLFDHRVADRTTPPLRLSRVRVDSTTDPDRFELLISGLHPWIHRLRGRS